MLLLGFPGGSDGKETACSEGELGSIPGLGSSPGGEHGNPLQYSCLENPMNRGSWLAQAYGVAKSQTQRKQLSVTESVEYKYGEFYRSKEESLEKSRQRASAMTDYFALEIQRRGELFGEGQAAQRASSREKGQKKAVVMLWVRMLKIYRVLYLFVNGL